MKEAVTETKSENLYFITVIQSSDYKYVHYVQIAITFLKSISDSYLFL